MLPISPDITIRELQPSDATTVANLLNQASGTLAYCQMYDAESVRSDILSETAAPLTDQTEWHSRQRSGAWKAGKLIGFIDTAVCKIEEEQVAVGSATSGVLPQQPSAFDRYCGIIRGFILPNDPELSTVVERVLLGPIEERWREGGIEMIRAFVPSTGYPRIQAGIGILPAEWREHFRLLTASGYQLAQRYRAMMMTLDTFVAEVYPTVSISLETHRTDRGWRSQLYHRRINPIGSIDMIGTTVAVETTKPDEPRDGSDTLTPVAVIDSFTIDDEWRGNNLGKLLLRRAINDSHHQGYQQMLMYLRQDHHRGWSLLAQHGFQELDYRGYTFQKQLISTAA